MNIDTFTPGSMYTCEDDECRCVVEYAGAASIEYHDDLLLFRSLTQLIDNGEVAAEPGEVQVLDTDRAFEIMQPVMHELAPPD